MWKNKVKKKHLIISFKIRHNYEHFHLLRFKKIAYVYHWNNLALSKLFSIPENKIFAATSS